MVISTYSPQEKIEKVIELQKSNGGCELPCWWGITPGKDSWDKFSKIIIPFSDINLVFPHENNITHHYLEFPGIGKNLVVDVYVDDEGIIDIIRIGKDVVMEKFLSDFGLPEQVWISSDGIVPGPSEFRIAFFYPREGYMGAYIGEATLREQNNNEVIRICPDDFLGRVILWLWSPESDKEFSDIPVERLIGKPPTTLSLVRLEEYSNYNGTTFYQDVIDKSINACIEVDASIWPNPSRYETIEP